MQEVDPLLGSTLAARIPVTKGLLGSPCVARGPRLRQLVLFPHPDEVEALRLVPGAVEATTLMGYLHDSFKHWELLASRPHATSRRTHTPTRNLSRCCLGLRRRQ